MPIEVGRFPDRRLKAIRKHKKTDSNVRVNGEEVTIVSTVNEVELEKDVIDAFNIWNLLYRFPELRIQVNKVLRDYFQSRAR